MYHDTVTYVMWSRKMSWNSLILIFSGRLGVNKSLQFHLYFNVPSSTKMVISVEMQVQFSWGFLQNIALTMKHSITSKTRFSFCSSSESFCLITSQGSRQPGIWGFFCSVWPTGLLTEEQIVIIGIRYRADYCLICGIIRRPFTQGFCHVVHTHKEYIKPRIKDTWTRSQQFNV